MGLRSLKQIEASRLNGAKSRGPVAKKVARDAEKNALRYQLISGTVVLSGESSPRFIELLNSFVEQLKPSNDLELVLAGNMAMAHWRQMRAAGLLKCEIEKGMTRHDGPAPNRAAEVLKDPDHSLAALQRDEMVYERQFCRNLRALLQLKEGRLIPSQSIAIELTPSGGTWEPEPPDEEE